METQNRRITHTNETDTTHKPKKNHNNKRKANKTTWQHKPKKNTNKTHNTHKKTSEEYEYDKSEEEDEQ